MATRKVLVGDVMAGFPTHGPFNPGDILVAPDGSPLFGNVVPPLPGIVMSRSGRVGPGTYLSVSQIPTSATGYPVSSAVNLVALQISTSALVTTLTRVQLQRRTGVATLVDIPLAFVDILAGNYKGINTMIKIPLGPNDEIAAYVLLGDFLSNPILGGFTVFQG